MLWLPGVGRGGKEGRVRGDGRGSLPWYLGPLALYRLVIAMVTRGRPEGKGVVVIVVGGEERGRRRESGRGKEGRERMGEGRESRTIDSKSRHVPSFDWAADEANHMV